MLVSATALVAVLQMNTQIGAQEEHGVTPAEIERGGQTFLASCAVCHGPDGDTIAGVNLASGTFRHGTTDQELINIIRNGIPGTAIAQFATFNSTDDTTALAFDDIEFNFAPRGWDAGNGDGEPVPEPSTVIGGLLGLLLGVAVWQMRRRGAV